MEEFVGNISNAVGSDWPTLLNALSLEAGAKEKIELKYCYSGENKFKLCAKEALDLWQRKPSIWTLTEEEKIVKLLEVIQSIESLRHVFAETSLKSLKMRIRDQSGGAGVQSFSPVLGRTLKHHSQGSKQTVVSQLPVVILSGTPSVSHGVSHIQQASTPKYYRHMQQVRPPHQLTHTASDSDSPGSWIVVTTRGSAGIYPLHTESQHIMAPCTQTNGFTTNMETVPLATPIVIEDPCEVIINIRDKYHKFALLDASQRILRGTWKVLCRKFSIPGDVIEKLELEKNVNERYYKLFVHYVKEHKEKATFKELRRILLECDEKLAVAVIEERLRSRKDLLVSAIEYDFLQDKNIQ